MSMTVIHISRQGVDEAHRGCARKGAWCRSSIGDAGSGRRRPGAPGARDGPLFPEGREDHDVSVYPDAGWPSEVWVAVTRCALGTCGVARCSWGSCGRTLCCAVVRGLARSYLLAPGRTLDGLQGTTSRGRVRPREERTTAMVEVRPREEERYRCAGPCDPESCWALDPGRSPALSRPAFLHESDDGVVGLVQECPTRGPGGRARRRRTDLDAEPDRSRHGTEPISTRK